MNTRARAACFLPTKSHTCQTAKVVEDRYRVKPGGASLATGSSLAGARLPFLSSSHPRAFLASLLAGASVARAAVTRSSRNLSLERRGGAAPRGGLPPTAPPPALRTAAPLCSSRRAADGRRVRSRRRAVLSCPLPPPRRVVASAPAAAPCSDGRHVRSAALPPRRRAAAGVSATDRSIDRAMIARATGTLFSSLGDADTRRVRILATNALGFLRITARSAWQTVGGRGEDALSVAVVVLRRRSRTASVTRGARQECLPPFPRRSHRCSLSCYGPRADDLGPHNLIVLCPRRHLDRRGLDLPADGHVRLRHARELRGLLRRHDHRRRDTAVVRPGSALVLRRGERRAVVRAPRRASAIPPPRPLSAIPFSSLPRATAVLLPPRCSPARDGSKHVDQSRRAPPPRTEERRIRRGRATPPPPPRRSAS